jgi:predicted  nucleic acid-binding Zn-ribbon protein
MLATNYTDYIKPEANNLRSDLSNYIHEIKKTLWAETMKGMNFTSVIEKEFERARKNHSGLQENVRSLMNKFSLIETELIALEDQFDFLAHKLSNQEFEKNLEVHKFAEEIRTKYAEFYSLENEINAVKGKLEKAEKLLLIRKKVISLYQKKCEENQAVKFFNKVKERVDRDREKKANILVKKISLGERVPPSAFSTARLGPHHKKVKRALIQLNIQTDWKLMARKEAFRIASLANQGLALAGEAPRSTFEFIAKGNRVYAINNKGRRVFQWVVTPFSIYPVPFGGALWAKRVTADMSNGKSDAIKDAPRATVAFVNKQNKVFAVNSKGINIACWAVYKNQEVELCWTIPPFGTDKIKTQGGRLVCFNKSNQELASYPKNVCIKDYGKVVHHHYRVSKRGKTIKNQL